LCVEDGAWEPWAGWNPLPLIGARPGLTPSGAVFCSHG